MDLDSIIQNLSQLGAELDAADDSANNSPLRSSADSRSSGQQKKKSKHNVSFSDKPVFYESEPQSEADQTEHIYEGLDHNIVGSAPITLASLLESRKSQLTTEETKVSSLDTELESVLRELHVLSEECQSIGQVDVDRTPNGGDDLDDDDDDDDFPPPPIPPPPAMEALNEVDDDDDDDDDTLRNKTSSRELLSDSAAQTLTSQATDVRPLSYDSNFSSDSTSTNTNDSVSNKSSDSHSDKLIHSSSKHGLRYQPHSTSFSDSLPQVTAHPKNSNQMCVKVHSEDGSAKTIAVSRETTVHQLCCILVKKYRHPISNAWSIVEQWNDICSERLLEGHLRVVEEVKKWPQDSDNQLWFADITKKYDLFNDPQVRESLMTNSFVPNCEGQLYLKSLCKNSWKKFHFVLRSSGLYYGTKGKSNKSADLTCLSNLLDVDIFTALHSWHKEFKAPTRFGIALKPIGSSKLNIQNPLKCLCAEDAKTLQKWVDALRLAKYGKKLYEDFVNPVVLPPPAVPPLPHHVAASWSNLIEDELDRVANDHRLQKSSVSLRDCSRLNASLDSSFQAERKSDSVHSDDKMMEVMHPRLSNSGYHSCGTYSTEQIQPLANVYSPYKSNLDPNSMCCYQRIAPSTPHLVHVGHSGGRTSNCQDIGPLRSSTSFDKNLPFRSRDDTYVGALSATKFSPVEPVYDSIGDVPPVRHDSFQFQTSPFHQEHVYTSNSPRATLMNSDLSPEGRTKPAYAWLHFGRAPLLAMNPLPQRPLMNGSRGPSEIGSIVENTSKESFEFPPPPTPEIFQFLEQNKNDLLPQKQNIYEVPSIGHRPYHQPPPTSANEFYRQGSLNRAFAKGLVHLDHDYRVLNNSYTMEPTEFSFLKGMHHSFHSADRGPKTSPKRKSILPPPPPRRLETTGLRGKPPIYNIPHAVSFHRPSLNSARSDSGVGFRTSRTQNVIDLLNKMVIQKLELGASGPANRRGSFCGNELDDLPPAPKELLENLKLMRVNDKQRFVFCNS